MAKYLSGRVKRTGQAFLSTDRYQFLGLEQAEPNLADPPAGGTSPNIPVGQRSQIISVQGFPGERFWVPVEGGIIPGSVSVFEEGVLVGGLSSTTQLDFKGNIITAIGNRTGLSNPGVAVTLSVDPPGTDGQLLFNKNGDFGGATLFNYDDSTVGVASVGIGTTAPTQNLHILGNIRLENKFFDANNNEGANGQVLKRNETGGLEYTNVETLSVGAGGTFNNIQFHDDSGLLDGASNFVYVETTNRVGLGSTQPKVLFDVLGNTRFTGINTFSDLRVSGILSASVENGGVDFETDVRFEGANYNAEWDISESALEFEDNAKAVFGTDLDLQIYHDSTSDQSIIKAESKIISIMSGDKVEIEDENGVNIAIFEKSGGVGLFHDGGAKKFETAETGAIVTGIFTATQEIQSDKITTIENNFVQIDVSGIATLGITTTTSLFADNAIIGFGTITDKLNVTGFTTTKNIFVAGVGTYVGELQVDKIKINDTKIESTNGNLILESSTNTITANDVIFVDNSDDSTSKDTGSIITQGGIGIEKGLSVGKNLTVGGATTLASSGGITTTGGDLFVGDNLFVKEDIVLRNITAGSANVTGLSTFVGLSTFNDGISVESGFSTFRGNVFVAVGATVGLGDSVFIPDNKRVIFGNDDDLRIYHDSTKDQSIIRSFKKISLMSADAIEIEDENGKQLADFTKGGASRLFFNANGDATDLKFETTNEGVKISGMTSMTGGLQVGTTVDSSLIPEIDAALGGYDLGDDIRSWNKLYIKKIIGTEEIAVEETSVERLDVTGIATIANLNVLGITTTKNLRVTGFSTFLEDSIILGDVGIGTTDPLRKVDVIGNSLLIRPTHVTGDHSSGNANAVNNSIIVRMPYGENAATTSNAGARFGIQFTGANNTTDQTTLNFGNDPVKSASIYGVSEDTLGYNRKVGLVFYTSEFDATQEERLRITNDGKVGINAANPNSIFEVRANAPTYTNAVTVFTGNTTHSGSNNKNGIGLYSYGDALKGGLSSNLIYSNSDTPTQSYESRSSGRIEFFNTTTADKTSEITFGGYYKGSTSFVERLKIDSDGHLLPDSSVSVTQNIGSSGNQWLGVYAKNFYGELIDVQKQFTTASLDVTGLSTFRGAVDINASVDISDNLVVDGNTTLGDATSDTLTVNASSTFKNDDGIFIKSETNNPTNGAQIRFSTDNTDYDQIGHIRYRHGNNDVAPGSKDGFIIGGSEDLTVVKVEGRGIFDEKVGININDPKAILDVGGNSNNEIQAIMTRGNDDKFRIQFVNQSGSNATGASQGKFGLFYETDDSDIAGMQFHRGTTLKGAGSLSFTTGGEEKLSVDNEGNLLPGSTANQQDIGSTEKKWNGIYADKFYGTLVDIQTVFTTGSLDVTGLSTFRGAVDIDASVDIKDNLVVNGNVDLGDNSSDSITATGRFDSSLIPTNDDSVDLGLSNRQWKDLYIDGTANIDILDVDEGANIQGGAVINTLTVEDLAEDEIVFITKNADDIVGKLETSSKLKFTSTETKTELFVDGNIKVTGDLEYENVTNVDAVGIITAGKGLRVTEGGIVVTSGISTFKDKVELENVIQPKEGNSSSVGIQWKSNAFGGSGDEAYIRYYRKGETGENTRLEIANKNDGSDDLLLTAPLVTASANLKVTTNLDVIGDTDLGNASSNTLTINAKVDSSILPNEASKYTLGNSDLMWEEVYADTFYGAIEGEATSAKKVNVALAADDASYHITFVKSSPDSTEQTISADTNLLYNPVGNQLLVPKIKPESIVDSSDSTGDDGYVPVADGTGDWAWGLNSDTKYDFVCKKSAGAEGSEFNPSLRLTTTGDDDDVQLVGEGSVTVKRNNDNKLTITGATAGGLTLDGTVTQVFELDGASLKAKDTPDEKDKIVFYDDSSEKLQYLSIGAGLEISGTELKADSSEISVQDEGVTLTTGAQVIDFRGGGVEAKNNAFVAFVKEITIPGLQVQDESTVLAGNTEILKFTGDVVTASGDGTTKTINITGGSGDGHVDLTNSTKNSFLNLTFAVNSSSEELLINDNNRLQVRPRDGALRVTGDITAFRSSDIRLKDNISPIKNALAKVSLISGNTFTWNEKSTDDKRGNHDTGVIAQEIATLGLPGISTTRHDGTQAVMYEKLIPLLIEAIKELKGEIDELKSTK